MKVLVCGDREWRNIAVIRRELKKLPQDTIIIHGAARGADTIGANVAYELGMRTVSFPADWKSFGKAAGVLRNIEMLDEKPDLVLAFHNDLNKSKGTAHTVSNAQKRGMTVKVITEREV